MIVGHSKSDADTQPARRGAGDILHIVVVVALVAGIVALAVDNRQEVTVGWVFGDGSLPLYLLFVGTFVVGILVGFLLNARRHHRSR